MPGARNRPGYTLQGRNPGDTAGEGRGQRPKNQDRTPKVARSRLRQTAIQKCRQGHQCLHRQRPPPHGRRHRPPRVTLTPPNSPVTHRDGDFFILKPTHLNQKRLRRLAKIISYGDFFNNTSQSDTIFLFLCFIRNS